MMRIPPAALILGLLGLIPFVYGALSVLVPDWRGIGQAWARNYHGIYILQIYGIVVLSFMSGVIWGFATKAEGTVAAAFYTLSVLPAILVFLTAFGGPENSLVVLAVAFALLLPIDWAAQARGLAPPWWIRLRGLLTGVVLICLGVGIFG